MKTVTEFYEWFDFDNDTKTLWIKTISDYGESEYPYIVEIRSKDDAYCVLYDKMFTRGSEAQKHFLQIKHEMEKGTWKMNV